MERQSSVMKLRHGARWATEIMVSPGSRAWSRAESASSVASSTAEVASSRNNQSGR